jgi:hypothetical protein
MKLTCREASRLLSRGLDRKLTVGQRASLRLHLTLCDACTRVKAQFEFIRRALSTYSDGSEPGHSDENERKQPPP